MNLLFEVKKTNQLSNSEIIMISNLIKTSLDHSFNILDFKNKYEKTFLNYSYHGLIKNSNQILGAYNVIPYKFESDNHQIYVAQSVDTVIEKKIRGNPFNLKKIAYKVYDELKKENFKLVYGIPNKKIYLVRKKILKWCDLFDIYKYFNFSFPFFFKSKNYSNLKNVLNDNFYFNKYNNDSINNNCKYLGNKIIGKIYIKNINFFKSASQNLNQINDNRKLINIKFFFCNKKLHIPNFTLLPKIFDKNKVTICGKYLTESDNEKKNIHKKIFFSLKDLDIY